MRIREAKNHPMDPDPDPDADPEHCYKVIKKSQNRRNEGFSYYVCLMMEGSVAGSVHVTNGSGCRSGRPKTFGFCGSGSTTLQMITGDNTVTYPSVTYLFLDCESSSLSIVYGGRSDVFLVLKCD